MTYFADLTGYTYIRTGDASRPGTKNVGWLGAGRAFETAPATQELLDRLWSYCTVSVAQTRGVHQCEFCPGKDVHLAARNGDKLMLGTAEIRVFAGDGSIYAAPTLIYHYVSDHGYKPPEPFIQALSTQHAPPTTEYFDRLAQAYLDWRKTLVPELNPAPIDQPFIANQSSPQLVSDNKTAHDRNLTPEIRLRDIALLLVGGLIVGGILSFIGVLVARAITDSKFVAGVVAGTMLYGSWLLGYEWLARDQGWGSLQVRFSKTRSKVLLVAAASAIGLILLLGAVGSLLHRFGINLVQPPQLDILPQNFGQLLVALTLISIIAPLAEELIFRGLLLDWLKAKINVWAAAMILSVIFALLHNNSFKLGAIGAVAFGARMALGVATSAFAIRYRSLRASFVMHATYNGVVCVASLLNQG
jgi:membrane protease YdiL (CAAX protease family)